MDAVNRLSFRLSIWSGFWRVVVLPAMVLSGLVISDVSPTAAEPISKSTSTPLRRLPAPDNIAGPTLAELKSRMGRHGKTMSNLVQAVVLLDRPTIRTLAVNIGDEEIVAGVLADTKGGVRLPLPDQFYAEQDALRAAAQKLAAATLPGGDNKALALHFGTLTQTCVSCHEVYLHGRIELQAPSDFRTAPQPRKP